MRESTFKKYCLVIDEWLVNGFNGTKAYQKFYPNASDENAAVRFNELVRISKVQEYKESKQKQTSKELQITLERQIQELEDLKEMAKVGDKINEAINALKEQSKLLGLYEADNGQKKNIVNFDIKDIFKVDK